MEVHLQQLRPSSWCSRHGPEISLWGRLLFYSSALTFLWSVSADHPGDTMLVWIDYGSEEPELTRTLLLFLERHPQTLVPSAIVWEDTTDCLFINWSTTAKLPHILPPDLLSSNVFSSLHSSSAMLGGSSLFIPMVACSQLCVWHRGLLFSMSYGQGLCNSYPHIYCCALVRFSGATHLFSDLSSSFLLTWAPLTRLCLFVRLSPQSSAGWGPCFCQKGRVGLCLQSCPQSIIKISTSLLF